MTGSRSRKRETELDGDADAKRLKINTHTASPSGGTDGATTPPAKEGAVVSPEFFTPSKGQPLAFDEMRWKLANMPKSELSAIVNSKHHFRVGSDKVVKALMQVKEKRLSVFTKEGVKPPYLLLDPRQNLALRSDYGPSMNITLAEKDMLEVTKLIQSSGTSRMTVTTVDGNFTIAVKNTTTNEDFREVYDGCTTFASSDLFDPKDLKDGNIVCVFVFPYRNDINRLTFHFSKIILIADNVDWGEGAVTAKAPPVGFGPGLVLNANR